MKKEQGIETEYVKLQIVGGILRATYKPSVVTLQVAREAVKRRKEFCENRTYPQLIMDYSVAKLTKDARDYLASQEATEGVAAAAIIVNSVFKQTMMNFWIKVSTPKIPVRLFLRKEDAVEWLQQWVHLTTKN